MGIGRRAVPLLVRFCNTKPPERGVVQRRLTHEANQMMKSQSLRFRACLLHVEVFVFYNSWFPTRHRANEWFLQLPYKNSDSAHPSRLLSRVGKLQKHITRQISYNCTARMLSWSRQLKLFASYMGFQWLLAALSRVSMIFSYSFKGCKCLNSVWLLMLTPWSRL